MKQNQMWNYAKYSSVIADAKAWDIEQFYWEKKMVAIDSKKRKYRAEIKKKCSFGKQNETPQILLTIKKNVGDEKEGRNFFFHKTSQSHDNNKKDREGVRSQTHHWCSAGRIFLISTLIPQNFSKCQFWFDEQGKSTGTYTHSIVQSHFLWLFLSEVNEIQRHFPMPMPCSMYFVCRTVTDVTEYVAHAQTWCLSSKAD